ncbi:structural maintenance of chromosomes protein 1-like isoform X3 [Phalaenopsis equestris]|uniref:structural maintenance of chromosomes protein 1-like isoform X3 n=1 Tax=Phalaenopsis equestris TaxID=78828 RepID=UPI0009E5B06B|nr:structural maintenance of chromosomes protein 1-like isoform X3 [Phalaenopsis equestris]
MDAIVVEDENKGKDCIKENIRGKILQLKEEKNNVIKEISRIKPDLLKLESFITNTSEDIRKLEKRINETSDRIYGKFSKFVVIGKYYVRTPNVELHLKCSS